MKSTENFRLKMAARSTAMVAVETSIMLLITVSAFLGNLMVCWALYNSKKLRTVPNIYILALAISDILMAVMCMPLSVEVFLTSQYTHGNAVVQFQGFFSFFLSLASLQTMTVTAINRFCRVVKPELFRKHFTLYSTLGSLVVIVILAGLGASLPLMCGFAKYTFHYGKVFSYIDYATNTAAYVYTIFLKICYITIPTLITLWCYYNIFTTVKKHTSEMLSHRNQAKTGSLTMNVEEVRITKVLFATVMGFVLCWTPVAVIDMIDTFSNYTLSNPRQVYLFYIYMGYGSSAINPWIYGILNRSFRHEFIKVLRLKFTSNSDADASTSMASSTVRTHGHAVDINSPKPTCVIRTTGRVRVTKVAVAPIVESVQ